MKSFESSSRRKTYFTLLLSLFGLIFVAWLVVQGALFWTNKQLSEKDTLLASQNKQLQSYTSLSGFTKLQAVKELEGKYTDIPRSTHIKKIIAMLSDLQSLDVSHDQTMILSDFNVNLKNLSVKGRVSDLSVLYYSSLEKGIVSLIDRFRSLDFISDMRIKNYTKNGGFFSFVLEANVTNDGK